MLQSIVNFFKAIFMVITGFFEGINHLFTLVFDVSNMVFTVAGYLPVIVGFAITLIVVVSITKLILGRN